MGRYMGTPGPWVYQKINLINLKNLSIGNLETNTMVAHTYIAGEITPVEEANALLISKAPDMLRFLEDLLAHKTFASHLPTTALSLKKLVESIITIPDENS